QPALLNPSAIPVDALRDFSSKIPITENRAVFSFPLYRDGKTGRLLLSRYIGAGKLREFCLPAISGRENCASFAFPLYRDGKTARVLLSRYIGAGKLREFWRPGISGRENCGGFGVAKFAVLKTVFGRSWEQGLERVAGHCAVVV